MQGVSAAEIASEVQFLEDYVATGESGLQVRYAEDTDILARLTRENGTDRILMLVQSPLRILAQAMERGETPGETLHCWLASAQSARAILRRYRRRAVVADAARFFENPEEVLAALGLPRRPLVKDPAPPAEPADPILQLIAAEVLREVPGIRALIGEFDASAPVTGLDIDPADVDVAVE